MAQRTNENARENSDVSNMQQGYVGNGEHRGATSGRRDEVGTGSSWSQGAQGGSIGSTGSRSYYRSALDRTSRGMRGGETGSSWQGRQDWSRDDSGRGDLGRGDTGREWNRDWNRDTSRDWRTGDVGRGIGSGMGMSDERWRDERWMGRDQDRWRDEQRWRDDQSRGIASREPYGRGMESGSMGMGTGLGLGGGLGQGRVAQERWDIGNRRTRWQREPLMARDVMTRNVKAITRENTVREAAQIMKDENCGIVPVVDQNMKLLGVLTDRDILMRTLKDDRPFAQIRVSEVMTDDVECVTSEERLTDVIELMGDKQIRRVPVVDREDRLMGIISMGDIATRADYDEDLQDALERVSSRRSFWSRIFG